MNSAEAKTAIGGIAIGAVAIGGVLLLIGTMITVQDTSGDPFPGAVPFAIGGALVQLGVTAVLFWLLAHAVAPNRS